MSGLINKAKDALSGHKSHDTTAHDTTTHSTYDSHGTTGTGAGYGSNTTSGNYGSSTNDPAYDNSRSTNAGPHGSNMMNKVDPRIDSDRDNRNDPTSRVGGYGGQDTSSGAGYGSSNTGAGYGSSTTGAGHSSGTTGGNYGSSNAGPHNSSMMNKMDPRVDSDRDNRNDPSSRVGGYGGQDQYGSGAGAGYGTAHDTTTTGHHQGTTGAGGYGSNTHGSSNAGPHNSNMMNKMDPRVDSDRDNRNDPTSRVGGYGGQDQYGSGAGAGYGTAHDTTTTGHHQGSHHQGTSHQGGPHSSGLANQADPRFDSDRDGSRTYGGGAGGYGSNTHDTQGTQGGYGSSNTHGTHAGQGASAQEYATPGSGKSSNTAGPHNSNLMNKLDPRVDSDMDGGKTYGGNKTYQ